MIQRNWYLTVRDREAEGFLAEAHYADTYSDQALILEIERDTLNIKTAVLEVHRGSQKDGTRIPIPSLEGITAYFGSGRQLRQALEGDAFLLDMAVQAVTAAIQSETYFYQERGFSSSAVYDDYWEGLYKDACVYYSNLDRVTTRFMESVEEEYRGHNLFTRFVTTSVDDSGAAPVIQGHLLDFFHEMNLSLTLDAKDRVQKASAATLRCPDAVCREALERISALEGRELSIADLRKYPAICGGPQSCTHINHLVQEAAQALDIYRRKKGGDAQ